MSYVATAEFADQSMADYWRVQQCYADQPIDGLVGQVAGTGPTGLRIVSMWETTAQHDRFIAERLGPIFERLGGPAEMTFSDFAAEHLVRGSAAVPEPPQLLPGAPAPANRMYAMIVGSWVSQITGVLARLRIPDLLAGGPRTAAELAEQTDCSPEALFRLLRGAAAAGVLAAGQGGTFALTNEGGCLRSDVPGSLRALAGMLTAPGHWLPWGRLDSAVRTGDCPAETALGTDLFGHLTTHRAELAEFTEAMTGLSAMVAAAVAELLDLSTAAHVVDVGGGSGGLLALLLEKNPALHGTILERAEVVPDARALIATRGLQSRCEVVEGDFFAAVPAADVHVLKMIIHDWDDTEAVAILRNCAASLRPSGRVVLVEGVVPEDGQSRWSLLPLLDLNMMAVTGGRERTAAQYAALLDTAGLRLDRITTETGVPAHILEASRA